MNRYEHRKNFYQFVDGLWIPTKEEIDGIDVLIEGEEEEEIAEYER